MSSFFWFWFPDLDLSLSLSLEPDPEVEGVGLAFLSEFRFGLLVLSDFWLGFGVVGVSLETLYQCSQ